MPRVVAVEWAEADEKVDEERWEALEAVEKVDKPILVVVVDSVVDIVVSLDAGR